MCSIKAMQRLGMCNSVSIKSAVQKTVVGGAKNGGRGLEKKPYPLLGVFPNFHKMLLSIFF